MLESLIQKLLFLSPLTLQADEVTIDSSIQDAVSDVKYYVYFCSKQ